MRFSHEDQLDLEASLHFVYTSMRSLVDTLDDEWGVDTWDGVYRSIDDMVERLHGFECELRRRARKNV